jgi:penicillin-binding protein 1C
MKKRLLRYLLGAACLIVVSCVLLYVLCPRPELTVFTPYSSAVFDDSGGLLTLSLADDDRYRLYQGIDKVSAQFLAATLLYEDQHFYQHYGVDFLALLRAFWTSYISQQRRIGASTIVMQVARLRWGITSSKLSGKLTQVMRALQLARHYNKQQILEAYINMVPYGGNIEGIGAASLIYFNKLPSQLSLPEALTLAVIPQNPNKRNPATKQGYQQLQSARNNLLQRWLKIHPQDAPKRKYFTMPLKVRSIKQVPKLAPHFTRYVLNKTNIEQSSIEQHGVVKTSLKRAQQHKLEQGIKRYVATKSAIGINNAAALLVNYKTMAIEAMVGSADFYNRDIQGQVNGTIAKRSPGSTLKPFVYGLAIDEGLIHPKTLLKDSPSRYGGFTPENYDQKFFGPIMVKDALIQSRNVPAVAMQARLNKKSLFDFLQQGQVKGLKHEGFYGLALALGGAEVSMLELVRLYSVLANGGRLREIITRYDANAANKTMAKQQTQGKRLLSAEASFMVLDMLKDNPAPGALQINLKQRKKNQIAWKTGTSWAFRDAWAIGVSGPYVLAVWLGNFKGQGNNALIGRSAAGPLLFSLFDSLLAETDLPAQGWTFARAMAVNTLNLKKVAVCANTGDLYQKNCPSSESTWFIPGRSPIKVSNIYRPVAVDKISGLRACSPNEAETEIKIYEFWPSDFQHIFNQAGISLKSPPPYKASCNLDQKSSVGLKPVITSPMRNIDYVIQSAQTQKSHLVFSATVEPDVEKIFWFVNGQYEGSAAPDQPFTWQASNGKFKVLCVDDAGRSATQDITVLLL